MKKKVLIFGASGFVGKKISMALDREKFFVIGASRSIPDKHSCDEWLKIDLSNDEPLSANCGPIETAFYFVHGLSYPEDEFEFREQSQAINFVKWAKRNQVQKIVYLGGLIPSEDKISPHLRSRMTTGKILGLSEIPCLEFRASIVLGDDSLSFELIKALVERIPLRLEFSWTQKRCQPIALSDLLKYLQASIEMQITSHQIVEIGMKDQSTYGELMDLYAKESGLNRKIIHIPDIELRVFLKLMDYIVPEYAEIGKKLFLSLSHETIITDHSAQSVFPDIQTIGLNQGMKQAILASTTTYPSLWDREFIKLLLSDKLLVTSGLFKPELLKTFESLLRVKDIFIKK